MPSKSKKQQKFFNLVRAVQSGKVSPSKVGKEVRKVAKSISTKDAGDFAKSIAELKTKKAVLSILKDCREPMYLEEGESNAIVKEFNVEGKFEEYVKRYLGQPLSEKELEAINTFQDIKPTKIEPKQIRYETTDEFKNNNTTIIKKLREGGDFVYVAFTRFSKVEKKDSEGDVAGQSDPMAGGSPPMFERIDDNKFKLSEANPMDPMGMNDPNQMMNRDPMAGGMAPPPAAPAAGLPPPTSNAPMSGTSTKTPEERKKQMGIDDILIRKSTTFKDEIKGGSILAEFLKKLDL